MSDRTNFTLRVDMEERWVPHFLGLLSEMESLGQMGSSRTLSFFSDGDGDFRPHFEWDVQVEPANPAVDLMWDAG